MKPINDIKFRQRLSPVLYARDLRDRELSITQYPINLAKVFDKLSIKYGEDDFDGAQSYYGVLIRRNGAHIIVNSNIYESKKRFTAAHELGHFWIKDHTESMYRCDAQELEKFRSDVSVEREANEFASEFLLPEDEVRKKLRTKKASLEMARQLSERYQTSLTAAAFKMVSCSIDSCALIYSHEGRITWAQCSPQFREKCELRKGAIDENTYAFDIFIGKSVKDREQDVGPRGWLSRFPNGLNYIMEHSISFPNFNSALTFLRLPDSEESLDEEEDPY